MTTPDFWVTPLASSSAASRGKLGVNSGDSLSAESEAAVSVNFPAQLEEVASELSWLPEKQPSSAGLEGKKADAGGEINLSQELLGLEQEAGEQDSPGFGLSLPASTVSMAAGFSHFPPMAEAFQSSPGSADLPEIIVSGSQSAAQSSLLITRDIDGAPSGISPDSSKPVNSAVNLVLSG
ncbi:flagellar hook-length control protein, partial [Nitrosococcus oceani]